MEKLSEMTMYAIVYHVSFALKPWCSMRATFLIKDTSLALYTVHKLLRLLISKSDLTKTN